MPDLDQLPDADVASREGMSMDQLFRARLHFALDQSKALFAQVQFADAKAGALLVLRLAFGLAFFNAAATLVVAARR